MVSKTTLAALPNSEGLRKLTQSLAMLDAIMSPEWESASFELSEARIRVVSFARQPPGT